MFNKSIESVVPEVLETRLGAEVHMTGVNDPTDEALIKLAIEGTNLVLVEFPFHGKWHHSLFERLEDFILNTGYTPVVAHVERYEQVYAQPAVLTQLVQMGCLLQVNASAFLEKRWKKLAFALLKKGMVHCMGTDAHNLTTRKPDYRQAKEVIQASKYAGRWQEIQDCMEKLLKGETVEVEPKRIKKFLGLYL